MVRGSRLRQIGWAICIGVVFGVFMLLTFRVNAVKSEVVSAEREIVFLEREKLALETEFETRANQQQLRTLNEVEFGYQAPAAGQYLESERQLAELSKPRAPDAPSPIRVASADVPRVASALPAMVNPLTGKALAAEPSDVKRKATTDAGLNARLGSVDREGIRHE